MADKSSQLLLNALSRAAAEAAPVPWHGTKTAPGLFPATPAGRQAAQRCRDEGYLRGSEPAPAPEADGGVATAVKTKPALETCSITDKGLAYLLREVSPRPVLEDFVRVLEGRAAEVAQLLALGRQMQASLDALRAHAAQVLEQVRPTRPAPPGSDWKALFQQFCAGAPPRSEGAPALLPELERWAASGAPEDYPLPELFRKAKEADPGLTLGAFHDELRRLHDAGQVYLHPWTGPLYAIPEPPFALLVGHLVAYYASLRK